MRETNILMISDIHVGENFFLTDDESIDLYDCTAIEYLARKVSYDYHKNFNYLPDIIVIAGDLSEKGEIDELKDVSKFINFLIDYLNNRFDKENNTISKENIVIVPGNHDVNFKDCEKNMDPRKYNNKAWKVEEKLLNFKSFFDEFYRKTKKNIEFDYSQGYTYYPFYEHSLVILGLDSCRRISHLKDDNCGWIMPHQINKANKFINEMIGDSDFLKIAVFHHNPYPAPEFNKEIQDDFLLSYDSNKISFASGEFKILMHGHIHTNSFHQEKIGNHKMYVGGTGTLSRKTVGNDFGYLYTVTKLSTEHKKGYRLISRRLNISAGKNDEIGRGKWEKAGTTITHPLTYLGRRAKKDSLVKKYLKRLPTKTTLNKIEYKKKIELFYHFKILLEPDRSLSLLKDLRKSCKNIFDINYIDAMLREVEIQILSNQGEQRSVIRSKYIDLLNSISENKISTNHDTLLPEGILKLERNRLEIIIDYYSSPTKDKYIKSSIRLIQNNIELIKQYPYIENIVIVSLIPSLIKCKEYALARRHLSINLKINPNNPILHFLYARILMYDLSFREAIKELNIAQNILGEDKILAIEFYLSLCHYYNGDLEISEKMNMENAERYSFIPHFINNYAFGKLRELFRIQRSEIFKSPKKALNLLESFVDSIAEIGWNGVSHFNYALMLFFADQEGLLDEALRVITKDNMRQDLLTKKNKIEAAFVRAETALISEDKDYVRGIFARYYQLSVTKKLPNTFMKKILDELCWDADNFLTMKIQMYEQNKSFLFKNPKITDPFNHNHFNTLKRWARNINPIRGASKTGGGYFIKWEGRGIIINPGSNFLTFFKMNGYCICEIDSIVITYSDFYNYEEFLNLLELIDEVYSSRIKKKKVRVFLNKSISNKFPELLNYDKDSILGPQIILEEEDNILENDLAKIKILDKTTPIAILKLSNKKITKKIAFINEKSNLENVVDSFYNDIDLVVFSVGALSVKDIMDDEVMNYLNNYWVNINEDSKLDSQALGIKELLKRTKDKNNIFQSKMTTLLKLSEKMKKNSIIVLSDLPLELGDKRHMIARVLNRYRIDLQVLTSDLGLHIELNELKILCEYSNQLVDNRVIDEECLEGNIWGHVRHFCKELRSDDNFTKFLELDI
ncbi:MAG: metallophosphoesterase [Armatimonadetes bacterium]|nr:metallophosphoesterase [Armatimonadota bacterium]